MHCSGQLSPVLPTNGSGSSLIPVGFSVCICFHWPAPLLPAPIVGNLHLFHAVYSLPVYPRFIPVLELILCLSSLVFSAVSLTLDLFIESTCIPFQLVFCNAEEAELFWCPPTRQDLCSLGPPCNPSREETCPYSAPHSPHQCQSLDGHACSLVAGLTDYRAEEKPLLGFLSGHWAVFGRKWVWFLVS